MKHTTIDEVIKTIDSLPNKTSYGHDGISNTLLKMLKDSIAFPLTYIFNQSIKEGVFQSQMKMAKVIPLYKGKELYMVINY